MKKSTHEKRRKRGTASWAGKHLSELKPPSFLRGNRRKLWHAIAADLGADVMRCDEVKVVALALIELRQIEAAAKRTMDKLGPRFRAKRSLLSSEAGARYFDAYGRERETRPLTSAAVTLLRKWQRNLDTR